MAVSRKFTPEKRELTKPKRFSKFNAEAVDDEEGIKFCSKLERDTYGMLSEAGLAFAYEPGSVLLVEECRSGSDCFEHKSGKGLIKVRDHLAKITYKPDFVGPGWVMETKGMRTDVFDMRWKLFRMALAKSDYHPILFMPSSKLEVEECIRIIKGRLSSEGGPGDVNGWQMLLQALGKGRNIEA